MSTKDTAQKPEPTKTAEPTNSASSPVTAQKRWNASGLVWGIVLIGIGALALLDSLDVLNVNFLALWQLWPLLLIIWGVSLLKLRGIVGVLLTSLLVAGSVGLALWVAIRDDAPTPLQRTTATKDVKAAKPAKEITDLDVKITAGAGKITINSDKSTNPLTANLKSDFATLKNTETTDGTTRKITLQTEGNVRWWRGQVKNELSVLLGETLPVALALDTGAADVQADFSNVLLQKLNLNTGASAVDIVLGSRVAELTGTIDAGASNIILRVPKDSGIRVQVDGALSNKDFADLRETSTGVFESDGYETAAHKINLKADMGATNFRIVRR